MTKTRFIRIIWPAMFMRVEIIFTDSGRLSLFGGGRYGVGQNYELLTRIAPGKGFSAKDCLKLRDVWERWHLNYLRAGTPKQEKAVREWRKTAENKSYKAACDMLSEIGLLVDDGHRYGTAWLKEEVPMDVLEWLFSLPGVGDTFEDIYPPEIDATALYDVLNVRTV